MPPGKIFVPNYFTWIPANICSNSVNLCTERAMWVSPYISFFFCLNIIIIFICPFRISRTFKKTDWSMPCITPVWPFVLCRATNTHKINNYIINESDTKRYVVVEFYDSIGARTATVVQFQSESTVLFRQTNWVQSDQYHWLSIASITWNQTRRVFLKLKLREWLLIITTKSSNRMRLPVATFCAVVLTDDARRRSNRAVSPIHSNPLRPLVRDARLDFFHNTKTQLFLITWCDHLNSDR